MDKQERSMAIELSTFTIAELHRQLQAYIDQGLGDTPMVATDCRARYPFQAYTVSGFEHQTSRT